jgi:DNA-binding PadR family transcriptional regulator
MIGLPDMGLTLPGGSDTDVRVLTYTPSADIYSDVTEPLREPTFLLLTALAGGRLHGYGMVTEVGRISAGRVKLRAGTLYGALDRLVDQGLVAPDGDEVVDGRLRRYYVLTPAGGDLLRTEAERMAAQAAEASRRLKASAVRPRPGTAGAPA